MRRVLASLLTALVWVGGLTVPAIVPGTLTPLQPGPGALPVSGSYTGPGGGAFLPDKFSNARQFVQMAFGANLADPGSWIWTDVTTQVLWDPGFNIPSIGRANEASQAQPAKAEFTLKNNSGAFSPYNAFSQYWPGVQQDTPLRAFIDLGGGPVLRFQGYVNSFALQWDASRQRAVCVIVAAGVLRRLMRNTQKLHSALYRAITVATVQPSAYWPCEDGANVTQASTPIVGVAPMAIVNAGNFSATTGAPGSDSQPNFSAGGSLAGTVPGTSTVTSWRIQCAVRVNTISGGDFSVPLEWNTSDGTGWELLAESVANGGLSYSDTNANNFSSNKKIDDGLWHEIRATATQSGGNIVLTVFLDGVSVIARTFPGTLTRITQVFSNRGGSVSNVTAGVGHFAVWNNATSTPGLDTVAAMNGYTGETPTDRITRICKEQGIPVQVFGSSKTSMGAQPVGDFVSLLRDCETTDGGILYDGLGPGPGYITPLALYNQQPSLVLDATGGHIMQPYPPIEDDLLKRNSAQANQTSGLTSGAFASSTDTGSALGTGSAGVGTRNVAVSVNTSDTGYLSRRAQHEVKLGTVQEMRVPSLSINLAKRTDLATSWLGVTPGDYVHAVNVAALLPQVSTADVRALVNGYAERWNSKQWEVTMNCSPYRPWQVWVLQDPVYGRVDTATARLRDDAAVGAGTLVMLMDGTPTTDPAQFPFDLWISGIQVTCTNITGSAPGPWTLTVTGSTVTKKLHAGDQVRLWQPATPAL